MGNQNNVDIKVLMAKAKSHNAEQLAAARAQMEEQKSKALIEQLAKNLSFVESVVQDTVKDLRRERKIAKLYETKLQEIANAAAEFESNGDIDKFKKSVAKAANNLTKGYYKMS